MRTLMTGAVAAALAVCLCAPAAAQLRVDKSADLALPVVLGPNQGAIVIGFRRLDAMSAGKSAAAALYRYDRAARDLVAQPKGAKKAGDTTTYAVLAKTRDKKLPQEYAVMIVSAGDYVLAGATPGPGGQVLNNFCLGAPVFSVAAGETVYFGDFTPYIAVKLADGRSASAMAYSSHPDDARTALAKQAALSARFRPAAIVNAASFTCAAQAMLAYAVPGAPDLPTPAPSVRMAGQ